MEKKCRGKVVHQVILNYLLRKKVFCIIWLCRHLSLIIIFEPTRLGMISYAVFSLKT